MDVPDQQMIFSGLKGKVIDLCQEIVRVVNQPETLTLTQAQQAILIVEACTDFNNQRLNNTSNQTNTGYMCMCINVPPEIKSDAQGSAEVNRVS